ncbi:MAG: hypothetical protein A2015_13875 [Spirochaetes bacterium GWF1_31_7]|nr:MAG: hypothetical protein A2Y30_10950 [Spirochaetes bacterium GWE1_32_154]OHD46164.1 MAG: hypothetical protein A2Y29_08670 [Spirochaetes bacterium GWE2_31_10]OHD49906.1 MAG: hypothetical protein A2015_13875 [Spirochaetes bacterium GWF1_31_7]HBD93161.1 hypothetical protein [Spirochaetia bacterium]HBI37720.1 hypothetical protein [Spirochaetia bacterium]
MFHSLSLRKLIIFPFIIITTATVVITSSLILTQSMKSIAQSVNELTAETGFEIESHINSILNTPVLVNNINLTAMKKELYSIENRKERDRHFTGQLLLFPDIIMDFFGTPEGAFYGARRTNVQNIEVVVNDRSTSGSSVYYATNDDGDHTIQTAVFPDFDCRTRPWYTLAEQTGKPVFTGVYKHFVFNDLTITASLPYYRNDKLEGIFGSDILLGSLNRTLKELNRNTKTILFITEKDSGYLIANSFGADNFRISADGIQRLYPVDILPLAASKAYRTQKFSGFFEGTRVITRENLQWNIHLLIPRSFYYDRIYKSIIITVIICLIVLALSLVSGFIITKAITKPIIELASYSKKIADGQWDIPPSGITGTSEIVNLSRAFETMKEAIRYNINNLESLVEQKAALIMAEREQLESLFDGIPEPIFVSDRNTYEIIYSNKAFRDAFGFESYKKHCFKVVHNKIKPCDFCTNDILMSSNAPYYWQGYNEHVKKHYYYIERAINWYGHEEARFQLGIDITKLKETEEQLIKNKAELVELNAVKDRFFSIIAHDLKNPFNAILGFTEHLLASWSDHKYSENLDFIKIIHNSAESAYKLLENLLEWSRSQTGKIAFKPECLNISEVVSISSGVLCSQAQQKNIEIRSEINDELTVYGDKNMLSTVLRNLISNAIKFTHSGGIVTVRGVKNQTHITLFITDNGIGIPPEILDKLFKINEKTSRTGTADETGTGLGLLLCKDFIDKHNGTIQVESEPGKGSSFIITFPVYNNGDAKLQLK